eukprot:CAMPEP_0116079550 /NCGR_PEP_ID=MMETSP0327-20121206/1201_1 /TAXON_ID=44447 /ORGANISM="Pseudo-nitzschia delicatissima, Strain B596" /LENGTH=282 /DNA_ID=CAMNT_0003570181 /DNA_START=123 /DNA_END=971 /DNA_ORIENTATION=+
MMLINENTNQTTGTIMKMSPENRPTVTSEDENSCSSRDNQQEHSVKRAIHFRKTTKEKADNILIRQATASIADALLRLGGSEDGSDTSSCANMIKSRKRTVSLAVEADSCSTNSQSTGNDTGAPSNHKHTNKRQRTTTPPSHVVCSTPTKLCFPESSKAVSHELRTRMKLNSWKEDQTLSFSTSEFQIKLSEKVPGDLGCISQLFHRDFRPLSAAPRMPREIVPEDPPMRPMRSPYAHPLSQGTMYSTAITEHNDCLIMHSYTVLPRMVPSHMTLAQLANGM